LNSFRIPCIRERREIENLYNERARLDAIVVEFKSNNEKYLDNIKQAAEEKVKDVLTNGKLLPTWSGACDELAKIAKPTLVITGSDDNMYVPHVNSLKIVEKIPGAWLVQIKNAGHAVMDKYPEEIGNILNTFLSTTVQSK
jgi:pimeloyl-ACP methyl ester carboxylesterase